MINSWDCLLHAFAYSFGKPVAELIKAVGHDGSEIIWEGYDDPYCRRAFHPQEFCVAGLKFGFATVCIEKVTEQAPSPSRKPYCQLYDIESILRHNTGVLTGTCLIRNVRHAISIKYGHIYDPVNVCKSLDSFDIETFWAIKRIECFS